MVTFNIPKDLSFVGNLKDVVLSGIGASKLHVKLYESNQLSNLIIDEVYEADNNDNVTIDIKSVLTELLSTEIPPLDSFQETIRAKRYILNIGGISYPFSVINGGIDSDEDITDFLRHNFLTWQQDIRPLSTKSLLFLFYVAQEDCVFKANIYFDDTKNENIELSLLDKEYSSFNLSPARFQTMLGKTPISGEAWIENYAGISLTDKVGFRITDLPDGAQEYIYVNSLGGIDSIICTGVRSKKIKTSTDLTYIQSRARENKIDYSAIYKQNTGILTQHASEITTDFLLSKERYYFSGQKLIPIVIEESENEFIDNELNAFEFEYRFAEQPVYRCLQHKEGFPPEQQPPFPDKICACFDQIKGDHIIDRIHGYIATLTEERRIINFPATIPDAMRKTNPEFWLSDIPVNGDARCWMLKELTGTHTIDFATEKCTKSVFFRDVKRSSFNSALPIIIYKTELTPSEIETVIKYLNEYYFIEDEMDKRLLTDNTPSKDTNIFITDK